MAVACFGEVLLKWESLFFVHSRHELSVTVVWKRRADLSRVYYPLSGLRPPRVRHKRVHIRLKPVLIRPYGTPEGLWLLRNEFYPDNRLDVLKAVLPRNNEPQGRAVLLRELVAVYARCKECKLVGGLF